jgi:class 3 adenylate cyclase
MGKIRLIPFVAIIVAAISSCSSERGYVLGGDPVAIDRHWVEPYDFWQGPIESYRAKRMSLDFGPERGEFSGRIMRSYAGSFKAEKYGADVYLSLGFTQNPVRAWVNGFELISWGNPETPYVSYSFAPLYAKVPKSMLEYGGDNQVVIRFYPIKGDEKTIVEPPTVVRGDSGLLELLARRFAMTDFVVAASTLALLLAAIFAASGMHRGRLRPSFLYFSGLCVAFVIAYVEITLQNGIFDELLLKKLSKIGFALMAVAISGYSASFSGAKYAYRAFFAPACALFLPYAFFISIAPDKIAVDAFFRPATIGLFAFAFVPPAVASIRGLRLRDPDALILALGTAWTAASCALDAFAASGAFVPYMFYAPAGFIGFAIAVFGILARERTRLFEELAASRGELERLVDASSRFVPKEMLRFLGKTSIAEVRLGDQAVMEMTVLFSDLRGFTGLSESMTPGENFAFLNSYFGRTVPIIKANGGIIDKFMGDAVMALFPDGPIGAIAAAKTMRERLEDYNRGRGRAGYRPVDFGVGIHTGQIILGTVGEPSRMDTTVISDAVNIASRLEGITKRLGAPIIVSGRSLELCPEAKAKFPMRFLGSSQIKGKAASVPIYEVLSGDGDEVARRLDYAQRFEMALFHYETADYEKARIAFEELSRAHPDDGAVRYFAKLLSDEDPVASV